MFSYFSLKDDIITDLIHRANEHLNTHNIVIETRFAGELRGVNYYGIVIIQNGKETWFDDGINDGMICTWSQREEAQNYIENYVKPNMILCFDRQKIKRFQLQLAELAEHQI